LFFNASVVCLLSRRNYILCINQNKFKIQSIYNEYSGESPLRRVDSGLLTQMIKATPLKRPQSSSSYPSHCIQSVMPVCVCVCTYMYGCIYTYICIYMYMYVCVYIYIHTYICVCVCVCVCVCNVSVKQSKHNYIWYL